MSGLSFVWTGATPLAAELRKPIKQVALEFDHGRPMSVTLLRFDRTRLRMYSQMHDVAERREVGVLIFEMVYGPRPDETIVDVASAFQGEIAVSKLIIHESGTSAESGIVLEASNGDKIIVVAGASPCFIAVLGVVSMPHIFEPEYQLDRYERVPIA